MDFMQLAAERYSVRKFDSRPLDAADLDRILQAGHLAPTACNFQPQRILVIQGEDALEKVRRAHPLFGAPCALLVCCDKTRSWKRDFDGRDSGDIDAAIVTTHMMLQAAEIGVGSTWVMHFDPAILRDAFSLPEHIDPVALLPLGYPAEAAKPAHLHEKFRPAEEIVSYNQL